MAVSKETRILQEIVNLDKQIIYNLKEKIKSIEDLSKLQASHQGHLREAPENHIKLHNRMIEDLEKKKKILAWTLDPDDNTPY